MGAWRGLRWNEAVSYNDPRNDEIRMTRDSQPLRYAPAAPFALDPGTAFNYNAGLTQVMAAVIERGTKIPIEDYARTRLFEPLGITDVEWLGDLAGMPSAASGLRLRARDIAKFGSLYLHGGRGAANRFCRKTGLHGPRADRFDSGREPEPMPGASSGTGISGGTTVIPPDPARSKRALRSETGNNASLCFPGWTWS